MVGAAKVSSFWPLVSVIMPVRNGGAALAAAIRSVLDQTYRNFEFLILDDHSTDDTAKVLAQFAESDARIRIVVGEGSGITSSLNTLVREARGELIARQDADDLSHRCRFEDQVRLMQRNRDAVLCCTPALFVTDEGVPRTVFIPSRDDRGLRRDLFGGLNPIVHGTVMLRREALASFSAVYRGGHGEDLDLWLRLAKKGEFCATAQVRYYYRVSGAGLSLTNLSAQRALRKYIYKTHFTSRVGTAISDADYEREVSRILSSSQAAASKAKSLLVENEVREAIRAGDAARLVLLANAKSELSVMRRVAVRIMTWHPCILRCVRGWHDLSRELKIRPCGENSLAPSSWVGVEATSDGVAGVEKAAPSFERTRVSVVMAVRDESSAYLFQAIESILDQSHSEFELIIVDDGSTHPETLDVLARFEALSTRVKILRCDSIGLTRALNVGIRAVDTPVFFRHDSDDWSATERFDAQLSFFAKNPSVGVVGTLATICNADGERLWVKRMPGNKIDLDVLNRANPIAHGSWCVRTDLFRAAGGYDERFDFAQDYEFLLRAARMTEIGVVRKPLYFLRRHAHARSALSFSLQRAFSAAAQHVPVADGFIKRCVEDARSSPDVADVAPLLVTADLSLMNGESRRSIAAALRLIRLAPFRLDGWVRFVRVFLFPFAPLRPYLFR